MTHFAREYGSALYELAAEERIEQEIFEQIEFLRSCFREEPEYIRLLCARSIEIEERRNVLDQAFSSRVHPYVLNFMKLLTERGAMDQFEECAKRYHALYNDAFSIAEAEVTSAAELSEQQKQALSEKLQEISGKKIVLHTKVDPSLIGGLRVDMEGRRYDNSVRQRLRQLRRSLMES